MYSIINKIQMSLATNGFISTLRLCRVTSFRFILLGLKSSHRNARATLSQRDFEFDKRWGVDTSGTSIPNRSEIIGPNWLYGIRYQGINPDALDQLLSELPINHEEFTFVDFGSGKGRAIIVASRFAFKKIIGVEYSKQLHAIAQNNMSILQQNENSYKDFDLIWADAATYAPPKGPLVIFLYNPFGKKVMTQLVKNVSNSYQQEKRRIIVIYFSAAYPDLWRNIGFMKETQTKESFSIYDTDF